MNTELSTTQLKNAFATSRNNGCELYLIFDGAKPNMQRRLYQLGGDPKWVPLFLNTPYEYMLDLSPGVVKLDADNRLLEWYLDEGAQIGAGAVVASAQPLEEIAAHFQSYLEVVIPNQKRQVVLFRFYSPHILDEFVPSLQSHELSDFLKPASALWWPKTPVSEVNVQPAQTVWCEVSTPITGNNKANLYTSRASETERPLIAVAAAGTSAATVLSDAKESGQWHYGFRLISDNSYTALNGSGSRDFMDRLRCDIELAYPNIHRLIDKPGLQNYLKMHLAECEQAGISEQPDKVKRAMRMRLFYGWHFWDELEFMRGNRIAYIETPLSKEALNSVMRFLAEFQRDAEGLGTNTGFGARRFRKEAARRTRSLYFDPAAHQANSVAIADILTNLYPERANFMGTEKLKRLIAAADNHADEAKLPESTGMLCCALIFLFFGQGAFTDPLLEQWLGRVFVEPREIRSTTQWGDELLKRCCADICEWGSL